MDFENINIHSNHQVLRSVFMLFGCSVFYSVADKLKGEFCYETRQNIAGARS